MRTPLLAMLAVAAAAITPTPALAATRTVRVGDTFFGKPNTKPTVSVRKGSVVRWRWVGRQLHNVRVKRGPVKFRSRSQAKGSYSRTMKRAGTYKLVCEFHPAIMKMTLRVR
jgi:plastocyanin